MLDDCWQFDSEAGRFTGIDRVQMESTIRLMGIPPKRHREMLMNLKAMQAAALPILNRRAG